jgi:hypothetical protein
MGPQWLRDLLTAQGSKAKIAIWVRAAQSEERNDTKGGQQLAHPVPHRGNLTSSSFVSESQMGGFCHAPLCGLAPSRPDFLCGLSGKDV